MNKNVCPLCSLVSVVDSSSNYKTIIGGTYYVVNNVPAKHCFACGEYFFDLKMIQKLNRELKRNHREKAEGSTIYLDFTNVSFSNLSILPINNVIGIS